MIQMKHLFFNYDVYDVIQVNGDRAVIGIGDTVTSAIDVHNIERI